MFVCVVRWQFKFCQGLLAVKCMLINEWGWWCMRAVRVRQKYVLVMMDVYVGGGVCCRQVMV